MSAATPDRPEDPAPAARRAARARFVRKLRFDPDAFQVEAFDALDDGGSVLVSAPTGSGKTLVAAYAVDQALAAGGKAFYTTPLKALSNQKFGELAAAHGSERVGLLTGDTALRPEAPIVVMTTEVLRNMLLAGSDLLERLRTVVLDEVHYLQDPYRGGVWEEVLVLCPPTVTFVCLSATVSNAHELGEWLSSVRGPTTVVVERRRPVVLRHHLAIHRRHPEAGEPAGTDLLPLIRDGRPGGEALRLDQAARRIAHYEPAPRWRGSDHRHGPRLPFRGPRRTELVEALEDRDLLPAIVFIFSRAACDDAVAQCLREGMRLTHHHQRAEIRHIAESHVEDLSDDALDVLGYPQWLDGLTSGIASHHAGLVPAFRETVEECFAGGLLQVVFATETLSLGINMPARTVAIERFDKYGSAGRAPLTSGEYAQLTGRAGRRGLDEVGHAVVLWAPDTPVAEMARIAIAPPPDLRSAFRPTYNLAVNLVRRFDRPTAVSVLRRSFAQWQADAAAAAASAGSGPAGTGSAPAAGSGTTASETERAKRRRQAQDGKSKVTRRDILVDHLGRRLAVLEELGYVEDWSLTGRGTRLSRVYHESDLLVAEAIATDVLADAEPSVLAGVLSSLVFERRRARRPPGGPVHGRRRAAREVTREAQRRQRRPKSGGDRLGERRRQEIAERLGALDEVAERIRAVEEVHLVPRTRQPEHGLAGAVASWARGASFGTVLEVASQDVGEIAPGDFVRTVKQLVDLVGQVATVATDPPTAAAADAAVRLLRRDVVAAGGAIDLGE
ncbi:MAG TPA: DEAD/DEAH box helicase [Acidimicrobiales bacterium]|nr:DEAD/DEAH box helicase [Acidimicrobiales bacterium]